jgi:uncharacterized membrane protein YfcA
MLVKKWQKFTVLNAGMLLGVLASIFMLPSDTPTWLWASVCIVVIVAMNYLLLGKLRGSSGAQAKLPRSSTLIIAVGFLIFVIDLLYHLAHRSH